MQIEVAVPKSATTKEKGDLLEELSSQLLQVQGYEVIREIRLTAVELDLLCKHKVNGKEIYVECKAHRDNLDANILKNLLGTLTLKEYSEAWLISTAELGKEAKGFVKDWQQKPIATSSKMSFYTPEMVISSLVNAGIICPKPDQHPVLNKHSNNVGEWLFLITPFGRFWASTILLGGIPSGVLLFRGKNGELVTEELLLENVASTDTTIGNLNFKQALELATVSSKIEQVTSTDVVEVQHGDSWSDYRPARPKDFVGRKRDIETVFSLFNNIIKNQTLTRVFALTGDSGMGKSSLIAKIRDKSRNRYHKKKVFVYAVDVRAASSANYIYSALLAGLKSAQENGFGDQTVTLKISSASNPLDTPELNLFFDALESREQLVCLIFDQFEELYSKPELYAIFDNAKNLLLTANALQRNFCLGFAWKSDSTTQNDHPAYFMWHSLQDYRLTIKLQVFSDNDCNTVINVLEREIESKLENDLRQNILTSSQGYPWLLKKLCIHLLTRIMDGADQKHLLENKLNIEQLFNADLNELNLSERTCLDIIANKAPIDWYEVIELSGSDPLNSIINRRLVIRSGDRINIYWDIFREYLLTKKVPVIPLHYLPSTDFSSILKVAKHLSSSKPQTIKQLAQVSGFLEGTVGNIGTDMVMLDIAMRDNGCLLLNQEIKDLNPTTLLQAIRQKFAKHVFTLAIQKLPSNTLITVADATQLLKSIYENSLFSEKTWQTYTVRLCKFLSLCGFLNKRNSGWIFRDSGEVNVQLIGNRRRTSPIFTALTSPAHTVVALNWLISVSTIEKHSKLPKGFRNAFYILSRFELIEFKDNNLIPNREKLMKFGGPLQALFVSASTDESLVEAIRYIESNQIFQGSDLGFVFNKKYQLNWTPATQKRVGNGIRQWAEWIIEAKHNNSYISSPPGRANIQQDYLELLDLIDRRLEA